MKRKLLFIILILFSSGSYSATQCSAESVINPFSDISWGCIFPVRIGGVAQIGGNDPLEAEESKSVLCTCRIKNIPVKIGITMSFWQPARIIDSVSDPYCMMPLGTQLSNPQIGTKGGTAHNSNEADGEVIHFKQMHYYKFPAWALLDLFRDVPCLTEKEFDIAFMSEVNPAWNNDILSMLINPESALFSNPLSQASCVSDSISASTQGRPVNSLFWCMGSWGSTYPLSGSITSNDTSEAHAGIVSRGMFLMGRLGLLKDTNIDGCGFKYNPIWKKSSYKLHQMKPVTDSSCHAIGKSSLIWGAGKSPVTRGDNSSWMMFRRVKCCVSPHEVN